MSVDTKIIAITGGIGSGQSTASKILEANHNCKLINADLVARDIVRLNLKVKEHLREEFGTEIFDANDELKRKEFAAIVFADKNTVQRLNQIIHPALVEELINQIDIAVDQNKHDLIIIDAALIYELAIERYFDAVIVVYADHDIRLKRVIERDNLSEQQIRDRINNQFELEEKKEWADVVINNSGTLEELEQEIERAYNELQALFLQKK
jgi:dephospho-CoA kinase